MYGSKCMEAATCKEAMHEQLSKYVLTCLSAVGRGDGHAQPFASNAHAVQREIDIIRQVQRQQIQRASHPGPESLRPRTRDNRYHSTEQSCLVQAQ